MNNNQLACDQERIELFLQQQLSDVEQIEFESHLDDCVACRSALEQTAASGEVWDCVRESLAVKPSLSRSGVATTTATAESNKYDSFSAESVLKMLAPTDDDRMLGRLGTYEVVGVIGSGGMGVVLKAFDSALNRYVAIKVLAPHLASGGAARKRFSREAQAAAAVVHDNVIEIYGVSETNGLPYLVMPYVRGPSLQKRLDDDGPLSLVETLRIGKQAAEGLAAAHAQGLVHRDVKPANIMLADGIERVKLTDFGLARAADDLSLTKSGVIAGTPQYMSPEQARGDAVGPRSDLFSLGSVMYAMCTGRPPFRAETSYGILRRITDREPRPIREVNPDVPEWLCAIIAKLMSKQSEDRFNSAEEVANFLGDCLAHVQQPTTVPLPESCPSLREDSKSDVSDNQPTLQTRTSIQRLIRSPYFKLIAAACFAFALVFAGILIVLETHKGTLTIESDADNVPIRIMQGDQIVEKLAVSKSGASVRVAAGEYVVEIEGATDKIAVDDGAVSLQRGGREVVRIVKQSDKIETPLLHAIRKFNQKYQDHEIGKDQPPLTDDEVIASIRWAVMRDGQGGVSDSYWEQLRHVVEQRQLPPHWELKVVTVLEGVDGERFQTWSIRLVYRGTRGVPPYTHAIRDQLLWQLNPDGRPVELGELEPAGDAADSKPLAAAIHGFNRSHRRLAGLAMPPLTEQEVIASIRFQKTRRDRFDITDGEFARLQQIAETRRLPADSEISIIIGFQPGDGYRYDIWSVRLNMRKQVNTVPYPFTGFTIREHYVRSQSLDLDQIAWGRIAENGMQAGVRFEPRQAQYSVGQKVTPYFYYRNTGDRKFDLSFPNSVSGKLIAVDNAGVAIPLDQDRNPEWIVGSMSVGDFGFGSQHGIRGRPIVLGDVKRGDAEYAIRAKAGQAVRVHFVLSNYADRGGSQLETGEVVFSMESAVNGPTEGESISATGNDKPGPIDHNIQPPGGVPLSSLKPGAEISVDFINKATARLEAVPQAELEKWVAELERIIGEKLKDGLPSPRQACRTDFVTRMSVAFDGLKWNAKAAQDLFQRARAMPATEAVAWKAAFESVLNKKIGQTDTSNFDGGPAWAVPLVLIPVDALYDGHQYSVERANKYRGRLKQLTADDIALWVENVDRFGGTQLDAAVNIIRLDEFFDKEKFRRQDFVETVVANAAKQIAGQDAGESGHDASLDPRSAYDSYLAEVEARRGQPFAGWAVETWRRDWLARLLEAFEQAEDPDLRHSIATSALGLSNAVLEFDTSEKLLRELIQLARTPKEAASWKEELDGIPERRRDHGVFEASRLSGTWHWGQSIAVGGKQHKFDDGRVYIRDGRIITFAPNQQPDSQWSLLIESARDGVLVLRDPTKPEGKNRLFGRYELTGNRLALALNTDSESPGPPTQAEVENLIPGVNYSVLFRVPEDAVIPEEAAQIEEPSGAGESSTGFNQILGVWEVVSVEGSGGRFMSLTDESKPGDRLLIAHVDTSDKRRLWLSEEHRRNWSRDDSLHLYPEAEPSRLTYKARDGEGNHFRDTKNPPDYGIYRIEGDELTILAGDPQDFRVREGTDTAQTKSDRADGTTKPGGPATWKWKITIPNYAKQFQLEEGKRQILVRLRKVTTQAEPNVSGTGDSASADATLELLEFIKRRGEPRVAKYYRLEKPDRTMLCEWKRVSANVTISELSLPEHTNVTFKLRLFLPQRSPRGGDFGEHENFPMRISDDELAAVARGERFVRGFYYPMDAPKPDRTQVRAVTLQPGTDQAKWLSDTEKHGNLLAVIEVTRKADERPDGDDKNATPFKAGDTDSPHGRATDPAGDDHPMSLCTVPFPQLVQPTSWDASRYSAFLLSRPEFHAELKVDPSVSVRLSALYDVAQQKWLIAADDPDAEQEVAWPDVVSEMGELLTDAQRIRLAQLRCQQLGLSFITARDGANTSMLGLSKQQQQKITELIAFYEQAKTPFNHHSGDVEAQEITASRPDLLTDAKVAAVRKSWLQYWLDRQADATVIAELTPEQVDKLSELRGDPAAKVQSPTERFGRDVIRGLVETMLPGPYRTDLIHLQPPSKHDIVTQWLAGQQFEKGQEPRRDAMHVVREKLVDHVMDSQPADEMHPGQWHVAIYGSTIFRQGVVEPVGVTFTDVARFYPTEATENVSGAAGDGSDPRLDVEPEFNRQLISRWRLKSCEEHGARFTIDQLKRGDLPEKTTESKQVIAQWKNFAFASFDKSTFSFGPEPQRIAGRFEYRADFADDPHKIRFMEAAPRATEGRTDQAGEQEQVTLRGIIKVTADELKIAIAGQGSDYPKKFRAGGEDVLVLRYERDVSDAERLQGAWRMVGAELGGIEKPLNEQDREVRFVFDDNILNQPSYPPFIILQPAPFELNTKASPKQLVVKHVSPGSVKKPHAYLYRFRDGLLELCYDPENVGRFPKEFETAPDSSVSILTFRREATIDELRRQAEHDDAAATLKLIELVTRDVEPTVAATYYLETEKRRLLKKPSVTAGVTIVELPSLPERADVPIKLRLLLPHFSRRASEFVARNSIRLWVDEKDLAEVVEGKRFVRAFYYPKLPPEPDGPQLLTAHTLEPAENQREWLAETEKLGDLIAVIEITQGKPAEPAKSEVSAADRLQGVWLLESEEQFGGTTAAKDADSESLRLVVEGRTLRGCFDAPWKPLDWGIEFDRETDPQAMYLTTEVNNRQKQRSVRFRFQDDALKLCFNRRHPERLPVEFRTAEGVDAIIWILRLAEVASSSTRPDDEVSRVPAVESTSGLPPNRWRLRYSTNAKQLARILDFFGIEIGYVDRSTNEIVYLSAMNSESRATRRGLGIDEKRFSLVPDRELWPVLQSFARQTGVETADRVVQLFYPNELVSLLSRLESEHAKGQPVHLIDKTVFGVRPAALGFEYYVISQDTPRESFHARPDNDARLKQVADTASVSTDLALELQVVVNRKGEPEMAKCYWMKESDRRLLYERKFASGSATITELSDLPGHADETFTLRLILPERSGRTKYLRAHTNIIMQISDVELDAIARGQQFVRAFYFQFDLTKPSGGQIKSVALQPDTDQAMWLAETEKLGEPFAVIEVTRKAEPADQALHLRGAKAKKFVEKYSPAWGEEKSGLQLGVSRLIQRSDFGPGERLPLAMCLRNTGEKTLSVQRRIHIFAPKPLVRDSQGEKVSVAGDSSVRRGLVTTDFSETLKSNDVIVFAHPGLHTIPPPDEQDLVGFPLLMSREEWKTVPGKYALSQFDRFRITAIDGKSAEEDLVLHTGTLPFEIVSKRQSKTDEQPSRLRESMEYLAARQDDEGWFGTGVSPLEPNTGVTAVCALALLRADATWQQDRYEQKIDNAIEYILKHREDNGLLSRCEHASGPMYEHAFATWLLAEAIRSGRPMKLQDPLRKAVKLIVASQNEDGGWRYDPKLEAADVQVTAVTVVALAESRRAGVDVPQATFDRAAAYLKKCQNPIGGFRYQLAEGPEAPSRSAAALAALFECGKHGDADWRKGWAYVVSHLRTHESQSEGGANHLHFLHLFAMRASAAAEGDGEASAVASTTMVHSYLGTIRRADGSWPDPSFTPEYATAMACLALLSTPTSPENVKKDAVEAEYTSATGDAVHSVTFSPT